MSINNKYKYRFLIIFLLCFGYCNSQNDNRELFRKAKSLKEKELYFQSLRVYQDLASILSETGSDISALNSVYWELSNIYSILGFSKEQEYALEMHYLLSKKLLDFNLTTDYVRDLSMQKIAWYYYGEKDYKKSLSFMNEILGLKKIDHNVQEANILGIALNLFHLGEYKLSITWFKKYADEMWNTSGINHNYYLGIAYLHEKNYLLAKKYLELSLSRYQQYLNKPGYTSNKERLLLLNLYLGILNYQTGHTKLANEYFIKLAELSKTDVYKSLLYETEDRRESLVKEGKNYSDYLFNYAWKLEKEKDQKKQFNPINCLAYDIALLSKELLLNSSKTIKSSLPMNLTGEAKKTYNNWVSTKEIYSSIQNKNRDSLKDHLRIYEKKLISQYKGDIEKLFESSNNRWFNVRDKLEDHEIAIEFINFKDSWLDVNSKGSHYGALIIKKSSTYPEFVYLFNEQILNQILNDLENENLDDKEIVKKTYNENGAKLYDLLWEPLRMHLKKTKTIYYSPTALLHQLSMSAIPSIKDKKTIGELYLLNRVGSTKNIIKKTSPFSPKKALLFGDIQYKYVNKPNLLEKATNERGKDFSPLPGTKEEVYEISNLLKNNNITAYSLSEKSASEENFSIEIRNNPDILHLSTHAYYLKNAKSNSNYGGTDMIGLAKIKGELDPMNRSGLAMSGANYFWNSGEVINETSEDGLLTANEVSLLDLKNVELVVLSACETALGDTFNNEGVFGLQRGFKMAGASNLLLSLWKVDDKVTKEYMVDFYTNLIEKKMSIEDSYRTTQRTIKQKYPDPYYWAAFELIR